MSLSVTINSNPPGVQVSPASVYTVQIENRSQSVTVLIDRPVVSVGASNILMTPGPPGKSAYQIALDAGFVGTEADWLLSLKGESGSSDITLTAAEALGGHRVVTMQGGYADSSNPDHAFSLAGISLQAVGAGESASARSAGPLTESSWNWTVGQPVYLGNNGMPTQTPPASGFLAEIGRPINATTLLIDMQPSIILS